MLTKLRYGNTNTYFTKGLLIDTDLPGTLPALWRELKRRQIPFSSIRYMLVTHYHPDHCGLVSELMDRGVQLLLMEHQAEHVHSADDILGCKPIDESRAIVVGWRESRRFLASIGVAGEVLPTVSHSRDGAALVLDDGSCCVGDVAPMQWIGVSENDLALKRDWDLLLRRRPKTVYFGHANEQVLGPGF